MHWFSSGMSFWFHFQQLLSRLWVSFVELLLRKPRPAVSLVCKPDSVGVATEHGCCQSARWGDHEHKAKDCGARAGTAVSAGSCFHQLRGEAKPAALGFLLTFISLEGEPIPACPLVGNMREVPLWQCFHVGRKCWGRGVGGLLYSWV